MKLGAEMTVEIDGSYGEGGGQIIRSSLALSIITGKPCRITNIRAGRKNPGLQNQHLVAVRAAGAIGTAKVKGDELGSKQLSFEPASLNPGEYEFPIGTAGSTSLVLQTVLPALMMAQEPSSLLLEGGTHNPMAPPFDFLSKTFLPIIAKIGPKVECSFESYGFYPKGGGRVRVRIAPTGKLRRLHIGKRGRIEDVSADVLLVNLPRHIAERERRLLMDGLPELRTVNFIESTKSPGAGNLIAIHVRSDSLTETVTSLGEKGVKAELVAESAIAKARAYLDSGAPVGEYLADQLLLPMALAGGGSFITGPLSEHTRTNIFVIKQFLDIQIELEELADKTTKICVGERRAKE